MTFLEFLDRYFERRASQPSRPTRDIRQLIGAMFLLGYYIMVFRFSQKGLPPENVDLIRDAMLTLGPPIGIIIGAMFRSDKVDETRADNTGRALEAIRATAQATGVPNPVPADINLAPGEKATVSANTEEGQHAQ